MTAINLSQTNILRGWFNRRLAANNQDSQAYDFNAELDSSLTYKENKGKFESLLQAISGAEELKARDIKGEEIKTEEYYKPSHRHLWKQTKQDKRNKVKRCKVKGCKEIRQRD